MTEASPNRTESFAINRRQAVQQCVAGLTGAGAFLSTSRPVEAAMLEPRPWIRVRGLYGGFPQGMLDRGEAPADYGINAIWVGSGSLKSEEVDRYHKLGLKVFVEFNSMHEASYLKEHPDAAPLGPDGTPSPPPHGWQGVSPFHAGYRRNRMDEFRRVLTEYEIDGIWLDYHHAHASWERAEPVLPDTDFSATALQQFTRETGIELPADVPAAAKILLGPQQEAWTSFRCGVFTDWVREYRSIVSEVRPKALLGTFHCSWSPDEQDGAIRHKLAIDIPAQARFLDVLSIMPYHARFGHSTDIAWISRQTKKLGDLLGLKGSPEERLRIWPIAQLSDWGESVVAGDVEAIVDHASRSPATGVMVFHWSQLSQQWDKIEALGQAYRGLRGSP